MELPEDLQKQLKRARTDAKEIEAEKVKKKSSGRGFRRGFRPRGRGGYGGYGNHFQSGGFGS
jgi:hypothetical protein